MPVLYPMLQSAAIPQPVVDSAIHIAEIGAVGLVGWIGKEMRSMRRELTEWRVHFFGIDGHNGLTSKVKGLERRAYAWDKQLGDHETRLIVMEQWKEGYDG